MSNSTVKIIAFLSISLLLTGCFPAIFTGATTSAMAFAKDRPAADTLSDVKIATKIKAELLKSNFRNVYTRVKVEVVQGRVLLTGIVEKDEDAVTPVQVAWNQPGVTEVINEIKVDKAGGNFDIVQYTRDTMITSQIKSKLFINRDIKFINYTVITIRDVVYLFGIARSEEELEKVASIASNIHGVKEVVSHVQVNEQAHKVKNHEDKQEISAEHDGLSSSKTRDTGSVEPKKVKVIGDW